MDLILTSVNKAETTTPPGTPPQRSSGLSVTPGQHGAGSSPSKRRYVVDANDVEVVKRIKQNEIELTDRNTILRGTKPNVRLSFFPLFSLPELIKIWANFTFLSFAGDYRTSATFELCSQIG